ncbi:hypothetical protein EV183_000681 [Coemansia sp. RSA 2336]|nr:hypothetical protein EV183_000681 [Coemansia sp. RSA 2336]
MPNLSHFFFSTDELIDGEGPRGSNFTNYSVGRQIAPPSTPINVTLGVDVMLESSQLQANIDTQELLMYRQENDDYVETLSAEYIDRLIVTKLPEFLLLNSAHVIPDIPIHPFPDRYPHGTPWLFVTNRSMFFFADIRFDGHVTLPTSYSLAIFDRQNDRMLVDAHYDVLNEENQDNASSDDTAFDESSDESFDESSVDESHDDSASDNTIVDM